MYDKNFKIRDFVRENAKEWELFESFKLMLKAMNKKICYESLFKDNDIGHLSEYLAIALIDYWNGNIESASLMAEGIKACIDNEREAK